MFSCDRIAGIITIFKREEQKWGRISPHIGKVWCGRLRRWAESTVVYLAQRAYTALMTWPFSVSTPHIDVHCSPTCGNRTLMKNAAPPVGLEPMSFVAMSSAHHANHLHHSGWRIVQKLAGFYCYVIELLAMCYCLLKGCGFESRCSQFFLFECLIWE